MRTPPRRRTILRDWRKHKFGRNSASPPILRRSEKAANIKQENPNRGKVVKGSTWTGFFPSASQLRSDCANQPHEGVHLARNSRPVGTEILLQANSAKERDDESSERIIVVTSSTRCRQIVDEQLMGFHYARDHDLTGFWGEVCKLAHGVYREAAFLSPTPIANL